MAKWLTRGFLTRVNVADWFPAFTTKAQVDSVQKVLNQINQDALSILFL